MHVYVDGCICVYVCIYVYNVCMCVIYICMHNTIVGRYTQKVDLLFLSRF